MLLYNNFCSLEREVLRFIIIICCNPLLRERERGREEDIDKYRKLYTKNLIEIKPRFLGLLVFRIILMILFYLFSVRFIFFQFCFVCCTLSNKP